MQRAILFKIALKSRIIVSPIPKQSLEVMGKRVQQFHYGLVVVAVGWGEQEAQDDSRQTHHTVEFAAKGLHGLAATDSIVGRADKITGGFGPFVAHTRHRSRVNRGRLFQLLGLQHDLQAHPYSQDDRPEVALSPIGATAFIESWKERLQTGLMQSQEVILSGFTDQFLREGDGDQLTVRETWGWTRSVQGLLDHG